VTAFVLTLIGGAHLQFADRQAESSVDAVRRMVVTVLP